MLIFGLLLGAICTFLFFIIYGGLIYILRVVLVFRRILGLPDKPTRWPDLSEDQLPTVTIFVPAFNEGGRIGPRLDNISELDYPIEKLEIFVSSDGSTDNTVVEAKSWLASHPHYRGQVKIFEENVGRATAQNWGASVAWGEIFLNTDVETRFESNTLKKIANPFQDENVGAVGVKTNYHVVDEDGVGDMYAYYREMEYALRLEETKLGLCTKSDGPCTAVRTALWQPIALFEDIDYAIPPIVRKAGKTLVYAEDALAHDVANANATQEFTQRSRMTIRTLTSFAHHWSFVFFIKNFNFTLVFISHKILRVLSPFLLMGIIAAYLMVASAINFAFVAIVMPIVMLALLILVSLWVPSGSKIVRILRFLIIANYAFAVGVIKAMAGQKVHGYKPTRGFEAEQRTDV